MIIEFRFEAGPTSDHNAVNPEPSTAATLHREFSHTIPLSIIHTTGSPAARRPDCTTDLPAVLVVHLRRPRVTAAGMERAGENPTAARVYETQYIETLKSKQASSTWLGAAAGVLAWIFLIFLIGL